MRSEYRSPAHSAVPQLKRLLDQLGFQEGQLHPVLGSLDAQLKRMMVSDGCQERLLLWGDAALSETGAKAIDEMSDSVSALV
eukprot:XP_001696720.1 predicted protein [Chlamydomonas reinhardtii]